MAAASSKASVPSIAHSQSVRSQRTQTAAPSTIKTVITAPPWARDEPPSPTENESLPDSARWPSVSRPSDVTSLQSSAAATQTAESSRWWAFTLPGTRDGLSPPLVPPERKTPTLKERSMSWIPSSRRWSAEHGRREKDPDAVSPPTSPIDDLPDSIGRRAKPWDLQITLPPEPFTLSQSRTPGWDTPWQPRIAGNRDSEYNYIQAREGDDDNASQHLPRWKRRRKAIRAFILTNVYVPLLFRFVNITFTTAALAVAIKIRQWELRYQIMGAVGCSPTLVIIFAPLTLVHVMVAVYLEYFGKPLGLWRTSDKLAHTLIEVLFICAWSAALSLTFDNFFTSLIPCASHTHTAWYNQLPTPPSPVPDIGRGEGGIGDTICDYQLALICLVGVGLIMYCTNLVISLFRIFEKVKYHRAS
ncbi:hypothetical protein PLICRDRAFT_35761 [Plicaturopsis crispa FD-325 SS-3]|nr:hypothetical protein PLICRDRAFT_35761 [Plicaturopsis crispa FD-325 SS-3]